MPIDFLDWRAVTTSEVDDFENRLDASSRMVYQIAYGVLGNAADAEDVTQDVFLRAYRKRFGLRDKGKFTTWIARMSRRLALNRRRMDERARRREAVWNKREPPSPPVDEIVAARDDHARLKSSIAALPPKLRAVLLLCAVDGLDARSVAVILGIPQGTVRSRLHAARKQMIEAFRP